MRVACEYLFYARVSAINFQQIDNPIILKLSIESIISISPIQFTR